MIELAALATIAKYLGDFLKLRRDRNSGKAQRTLENYLEWLRREDHADLVSLIERSQELSKGIEQLIRDGRSRSEEELQRIIMELAEQRSAIGRMPHEIRGVLRDELGDHRKILFDRFSEVISSARPSIRDSLPAYSEFERDYRKVLQDELDRVELFGADLSKESQSQKLSAAYISLNLSSGDRESPTLRRADELLDTLPKQERRLLVRGEAGSGKSTLLRWLAVKAAKQELPGSPHLGEFRWISSSAFKPVDWSDVTINPANLLGPSFGLGTKPQADVGVGDWSLLPFDWHPWWMRVPFLLRIRDCKKGRLPKIEAFPEQVAPALGAPPIGWVSSVLKSGNALVLLDGIDETPKSYRHDLGRQIRQLVGTYPNSFFVVTTRPTAVEPNWLDELRFREAEVSPMGQEDRELFIQKWHEALALELKKLSRTDDSQSLADRLRAELRRNPAIALLASNPLLAAMVCALHRDRRAHLPEKHYELVEALCHMLVFRREHESGLDLLEFPSAYRDLSYPQRRTILQRLAAYMLQQGISAVDHKLARQKVSDELERIRGREPKDAPVVLDGVIERSGMLRERSDKSIDFIHNTFKEYLAARQFVREADRKTLVDHVAEPDWDNVLLFAAATPDDADCATQLIEKILPRGSSRPSRTRRSKPTETEAKDYRRRLMAVRMLAVAEQIDKELEKSVKKLERTLFPPRTLFDAAALAATGPGVERYLTYKPTMASPAKIACVRALRLLGTDQAKSELLAYACDKNWGVVEELAQAINPLLIDVVLEALSKPLVDSITTVGAVVRAQIRDLTQLPKLTNLRQLDLDQTGVTDLTPLAGLTQLKMLYLNQTGVTDLTPLAGLSQLQGLYLDQTGVTDLTPLAGLTQLKGLSLDQTGVTDLTPLAGLIKLQRLYLNQTGVADLTPLAGMAELQALYLNQTGVADLTPLAGRSQLQELYLNVTDVTDLTPLAGLTQMQQLGLTWTGVTDLRPLAGLTQMQQLGLNQTGVTDLTPVATLTQLKRLHLTQTGVTDLTPLAGLIKLQRLNLNQTGVTNLIPLAGLTQLQGLNLIQTGATDLTPLAGLTQLQVLDLTQTGVIDLTPLAGLTSVRINMDAGPKIHFPKELQGRINRVVRVPAAVAKASIRGPKLKS